jgi:hypothetical protein
MSFGMPNLRTSTGRGGLADDDEVIEMGIEVYCRYHHLSVSKFRRPRQLSCSHYN